MVDEVKSPIYATSVGLVLRGLADERASGGTINVSGKEFQEEKKKTALFDRIKDWLKDEVDVADYK
jgi:hypothetical protein